MGLVMHVLFSKICSALALQECSLTHAVWHIWGYIFQIDCKYHILNEETYLR